MEFFVPITMCKSIEEKQVYVARETNNFEFLDFLPQGKMADQLIPKPLPIMQTAKGQDEPGLTVG